MSENVNEHILSFRGKAMVDSPLALDHDYRVVSTITCRRVATTPNDDGTVDVTYTVEPITSEITDSMGKVVVAKKKSRQSVAMRMLIMEWMRDNAPEIEDDEVAYETAMGWIMRELPNILNWLKKKQD